MLSIIVAMANNNVIGKNNKLIWHLPEDLKHFKNLTTGHTIIMGRNTFESLGRILPNRRHVIFTKNDNFVINNENVKIVHSLIEIQDLIDSKEEVFVIGGAMIYNLLLPYTQKMYITKIYNTFNGDTFFPEFDKSKWKIIKVQKGLKNEINKFDYDFIYYEKISQKPKNSNL